MPRLEASVSVRDIDGVVAGLRREMADILRERAEHESPYVRQQLLQVADVFQERGDRWPQP